ncbi:hypothetical protein FEM48_Zijuj01G0136400 [Ziziphus jujuba var. spinosa]|uniref:Uncharacterized protein n=1 Tax=Ziziphus jujuba var. spinosa TaxID=714518 RepID=A0A978W1K6_ZIZJJ|nr:hypothetical protein FEM48_Zijuj01G0136400 [Ziziphus jujuba var. spinosa]
MVKSLGLIVCLSIMIMDVVAGILGIQAEIAQNKVKHLRKWIFDCRDPSSQAFKLGLAASIIMILAHFIANLLGGCICIRSSNDFKTATPNKQLAVASLIFSWIILAVGFSMLMIGTLSNSRSRKSCGIAHHRFLFIGGILCFIHGLFIVSYYVSAVATTKEEKKNRQRSQTTSVSTA